jgi:hypothetical protein
MTFARLKSVKQKWAVRGIMPLKAIELQGFIELLFVVHALFLTDGRR